MAWKGGAQFLLLALELEPIMLDFFSLLLEYE